MVGDFGWEHEGTKSGVGTVNVIHLEKLEKGFFVDTMDV